MIRPLADRALGDAEEARRLSERHPLGLAALAVLAVGSRGNLSKSHSYYTGCRQGAHPHGVVEGAELVCVERGGQDDVRSRGQPASRRVRRGLRAPTVRLAVRGDELVERVRLPDALAELVDISSRSSSSWWYRDVVPRGFEPAGAVLPLVARDLDLTHARGAAPIGPQRLDLRERCARRARSRDARARRRRGRGGT